MIVDFDDFHEQNHRYDLLHALHDANPAFRCTLFAVPACGNASFWNATPEWCELVPHGWLHPDPYECATWDYGRMRHYMDTIEQLPERFGRFVRGFKAPGWQINDGCYEALLDASWWVADQHLEDERRPHGLMTYLYEDQPDAFHGHVQNVCGNGLEERFDELLERVRTAREFRFVSEMVEPWRP